METGYLNFHDEEHFSDFSLSLDPHDSLEESSNSLMAIVESDFDYVETHQMDTTGGLWGTEQELNGDMAVLPDSGVASVIPKIENMKEDFAKVLIDWHEHIGYLQASDMEEDIDMSLSLPDKPTDLPADIFESPRMPALKSPRKSLGAPSTPDKQEQTMYKSFPSVLRGLVNPSQLGTSPGKIFEVSSPLKQSAVTPIQRKTQKSREDDPSESDDCIDIETVPEEVPVLEAGDVKSLLEQFEASEASSLHPQVYSGHDASPQDKSLELSKPNRHPVDSSKQTLLKKSLDSPASKFHKNIRDSLPKEVVDRIKASGRSKPISVIPALSQPRTLKNATRMQDAAATLSRNKLLKLVANSSKVEASVQLDHDYCSSIPSPAPDNSTKTIRKGQNNRLGIRRNLVKSKSWGDNSSRKDSGLESGDVSDASEEQGVVQRESKPREVIGQTFNQDGEPKPKPQDETVSSNSSSASISESISKSAPVYEMKIRSALATSILQLRQGVLTKTKSVTGVQKTKQMVSVLKKPPMPVVKCSEVASTENLREEKVVQIQNAPMLEEEKKPPRRKLNLAEYRSRREQTRSDNSRTCSPVQPMTLVYIHHASTTTEPLQDDPENPVWSEREIVSVLKPKTEVEEDKVKEKPSMCEKSVQTWEDEKEEEIREVAKVNDRRIRNYRHRRTSSSSSESRSPSRSRSRSRSRGRRRSSNRSRSSSSDSSCRSRSRSRSGSRSRRRNNRRRRISYRRSSVSSTSSWSSRSRSSYRSRSRSSRSRSRSSSSRSSRYSGCSRSPYRRAYDNWYSHEKERQVEERRVIYVGRLEDGVTKLELRRRFEIFGPVCDISLHFREHGDNYGFVTFAYKNDAYEAVEHGNDDITQPRYDLCFGGRRAFCKVKYADLDGMASNSFATGSRSMSNDGDNTFDLLLKEAKAKLRKRKV